MYRFRSFSLPEEDFRPLFAGQAERSGAEFVPGLPVTVVEASPKVEVLTGDRSFGAFARPVCGCSPRSK
ncbi:hypothetical protein EDC39_104119 [Geothermobacter ehrlichii]|uniref:Uncharacterized protein n=1 Tax=Geothermobacter ehrlichii TaxID=213224 RepID=A0A5D3WL57_9BACT|nr:hypothetical protein [Geothermobacter ehrlichii]TYO98995.1 hypothetical protein EDC39_104119 [Geothermobacter ehrlichii]